MSGACTCVGIRLNVIKTSLYDVMSRDGLITSANEVGRRLFIHPCLSVRRITQKVIDGFGRNFMGR